MVILVEGDVKFMKHLKGSASHKPLGTSGIVSDYRLDERGSQAETKDFFPYPLCPDQF
jgi:hypothetical protein